jgi:hypothetical protein
MTFQEINALNIEDLDSLLRERILARGIEETSIDEQILAIELCEYKDSLKKHELRKQVKDLVSNNCATVEAFPESASNYSAWIKDNILDNSDIETSIVNLQAIQAKEIELATLAVETADLDVRVKRIDKVFRKILVDMAHDALIAKGFSEKEIKELKDINP